MKCYCRQTSFINHESEKSILYEKGKVYDFKECPKQYFAPVGEEEIDFETASKDLLLSTTHWRKDELRKYMKERFNINTSPKIGREKLVEKFFDAKFREV